MRYQAIAALAVLAAASCAQKETATSDPDQASAVEFGKELARRASSGMDKMLLRSSIKEVPEGRRLEVSFIPYAMGADGVARSLENYCRGRGGTPRGQRCLNGASGSEVQLFSWQLQQSRSLKNGVELRVEEGVRPVGLEEFNFGATVASLREAFRTAAISAPEVTEHLSATANLANFLFGQGLTRATTRASGRDYDVVAEGIAGPDACMDVAYTIRRHVSASGLTELRICGVMSGPQWRAETVSQR